MKTMLLSLIVGIALTVLGAFAVWADEEKVPLDKLPKAVVEAVKEKFPKAELVSASKEDENGKTVFEVSIKRSEERRVGKECRL